MKRTIIFSAILFVAAMATTAKAQSGMGMGKVAFQDWHSSSGVPVGIVTFQVEGEGQSLLIFESIIPAATEEECFARTDFPNPRLLGPDRATLAFNEDTRTYTLQWVINKERVDGCRILRIGHSVDAADYVVWRKTDGTQGLAEESLTKDESRAAATQGRGIYQLSVGRIGP